MRIVRIVIDTNIYLNFYRMSKQSLASLDSLTKFVESKKIELILPKQIEDEFFRDKNTASKKFIENLEKVVLNIQEPEFLKSYKEVKNLKSTYKKIKPICQKIVKEHRNRILNPKSLINKKIEKIFALAIKNSENENILQRAYFRTLRGNPPRKGNNSFGDAIIWETILENYSDKNLVVISGDGDFSSETDMEKINEFLKREWENKNGKEIKLFTNFGEFINSFTKKNTIKNEIIKEEKRVSVMDEHIAKSIFGVGHANIVNTVDFPIDCCDSLIGLHVCSICGKSFKHNPNTIYQSECPDCRHNFITGVGTYKICNVCQKSYLEDYKNHFEINFKGMSENKCPECKNKSL